MLPAPELIGAALLALVRGPVVPLAAGFFIGGIMTLNSPDTAALMIKAQGVVGIASTGDTQAALNEIGVEVDGEDFGTWLRNQFESFKQQQ